MIRNMFVFSTSSIIATIICCQSLKAGPVSLPFFEPFNTQSADAAVDYPAFTATGSQSRTVDATGVLRLGNGSFPVAHWFTVTPSPAPTGEIVINVDMGWNGADRVPPVGPGSGATGLRIGENNILFHPGFTGPPGAFRVEGPGGFGNQDMGFTPAVGVLHHMEIHSFPSGLFTLKVTDGSNPANVYTNSFTNLASYGGLIGPAAVAGAVASFDNLSIRVVPEASTIALCATSILALGLWRSRTGH